MGVTARATDPATIPLLLDLLDDGFESRSWHGPNLLGALRGVSAEQAAWRPTPDRHNVRELVLHCAYWKYMVRRRLTGDRLRFPVPGPPSARRRHYEAREMLGYRAAVLEAASEEDDHG